MTTRKMYADVGWDTAHATYAHSNRVHTSVPVLVTNAEEMPDFGPGDRVRLDKLNDEGVVMGYPFIYDDIWWVPVAASTAKCIGAMGLTKLPREKTVTLRVAGPEAEVAKTIERVEENAGCGVTVEVDE